MYNDVALVVVKLTFYVNLTFTAPVLAASPNLYLEQTTKIAGHLLITFVDAAKTCAI